MFCSLNATAICPCNISPTISITTPDVVCFGTNLRQAISTPGQDCVPKPPVPGCPSCNQCPPDQVFIEWADHAMGPGYVDLSISIEACCGSDSDSKTVAVVGVTGVEGEGKACKGDTKTYTVTVVPAGQCDIIEWTLSGPITSSGVGCSFSPTFTEVGGYTIVASCGASSASKSVNVGAADGTSEGDACEQIPSIPSTSGPNAYNWGTLLDQEFGWGTWTESFELKTIGQAGPGGCEMSVTVGQIHLPGGWDVSPTLDTWLNKVGLSVSYSAPSSATFSGITLGPTDGIKYKLYVYWLEATYQASGWRKIRNPGYQGGWQQVSDGAFDKYSASDWLVRRCRWCCSL